MMNKNHIIKILKEEKHSFGIKQFVLFGSYAKQTNKKSSDVDIAYILDDGTSLTYETYLLLEEKLAKELKTKVDLMNFNKLNPLIKLNAKKDFIYV